MSNVRRTVEQLLASPEHRSRLFAVELMGKNAHVFDPVDLTERLKLASLDSHPEVANKAKLTMSSLLKQGFEEQKRIREMGIHSRLMDLSEADLLQEATARERASALLAPVMRRVVEIAQTVGPLTADALAVIGLSCDLELAGVLIHATEDLVRRTHAYAALRFFRIPELGDLVASLIDATRTPADLSALAGVLGEARVPSAIPVLASLLRNHDATVRAGAAAAISKIPDETAEAALIPALADPVPAVQIAAVTALSAVGRAPAVDALLAALPRLTSPEMLAPTFKVFGRAKSSRGLAQVIPYLSSSTPALRLAAVQALGMFKLSPEQVRAHLVPAAADADVEVRVAAIEALYPHDHEKAAAGLRALLASQRPTDRAAAMGIMGNVQDPQAMEDFLVAVNTEQDRSVLAGGLGALDRIVDPRLIKPVRRLMAHPNAAVQAKAVRAFGRMAGPPGIKELDRLYDESQSRELQATILSVLGTMCEAGNIGFLTKRLKEQDERVVAAAVEALDRIGSIENTILLESQLLHPAPRVRAAVVVALFHTGNFKCLTVLEDMLARPDQAAQSAALGAMREIHNSLRWPELQKRPLLVTPLMERPAVEKSATSVSMSAAISERLREDASRPLPRTTQKLAVDRTTQEERQLVKAVQALADSALPQARDIINRVIESEPGSELAHLLLQRLIAGTRETIPVPQELLDRSTFLPLLGEETRMAKAAHDTKRLLASYFRIFERQLDVMRAVIQEGREYLERGADAQAMDVAKFVVSQMQWTVDFDVRLGLVFYDKHDWERAFQHLLRAFLAAGGEASIGVHLAAVAMKVKKRDLAKTILRAILDGELTDPRVRERAMQIAQAIAQLEHPSP